MHICFLTHEYPKESFPHGGVGTFIRTLGRNLVASGIDVSVIGTNYSKRFEFENDEGVNIYRLPFRKFRGMTWFLSSRAVNKKLKELHKNKPIDIVESTELGLAFISKTKGVKYIIRLHGGHHFFPNRK